MTSFINALPGAITQGLIWGVMAIGLYITYKLLEISDLTVDGSFCSGGAVCVMLMLAGCNVWVAQSNTRYGIGVSQCSAGKISSANRS